MAEPFKDPPFIPIIIPSSVICEPVHLWNDPFRNIIWQCVFHLLPCKQANVLNVSMFRCSWFAHRVKLDKLSDQQLQRSRKLFILITFALSCCAACFAVFFPHLWTFNVPLIESSLKIQQPNRDMKTLQMSVIVKWRAPLLVWGTPSSLFLFWNILPRLFKHYFSQKHTVHMSRFPPASGSSLFMTFPQFYNHQCTKVICRFRCIMMWWEQL